jgi:hypothetical protein
MNLKLEMAANMKMLTASEIEMTDRGIKLTMPDQKLDADAENTVPERRKF